MSITKDLETASPAAALRERAVRRAREALGSRWEDAGPSDRFLAVSLAVRDVIVDRMIETERRLAGLSAKRVCYLSAEFLMGRSLGNNLRNLGLYEVCNEALSELDVPLDDILEAEPDAALGNGGLGRLAACFLDSLASMNLPAVGYGIRYEHGLFRQSLGSGRQVEAPDNWLYDDTPWLLTRHERMVQVPVYGRVVETKDLEGKSNPMWLDWQTVLGVPHDMPVVGYGGDTVQPLRLFEARSSNVFNMEIFNEGDYVRAVHDQVRSETISKVLYPCDEHPAGQELRLLQEYFFVACALRDMVRTFETQETDYHRFPDRFAIQLNDTHPAIMVPELMRMLVDEKGIPWERAWTITQKTCAFTNHTLLPEALECWSVELMERILPRHVQIIFEINRRFLDDVVLRYAHDNDRVPRMSVVAEDGERKFRMAHLAMVGSHSINGVSELHTDLLKATVVRDFAEMTPERFNNKTNGVTQRRWLLSSNPELASWITDKIGPAWIRDLDRLSELAPLAEDSDAQRAFMTIKRRNKVRLAEIALKTTRMTIDPDTLFDVQAKRIHEYKRQLLNLLHAVHLYAGIKERTHRNMIPRTILFAGKAAPGYRRAKEIIELVHVVGRVINRDPETRGLLRLVFLPDYRVSLAERLIPAADLSEQISTAGKEASGTGNMKFALNGALTIGTLDGANVEMREEVGPENIYIFGLTASEVSEVASVTYDPREICEAQPQVARTLRWLRSAAFNPDQRFQGIIDTLMSSQDAYLHLADFRSYVSAHERASADYLQPEVWAKKAILNVAGMGKFSSDRTILEYSREIWGLVPVL